MARGLRSLNVMIDCNHNVTVGAGGRGSVKQRPTASLRYTAASADPPKA